MFSVSSIPFRQGVDFSELVASARLGTTRVIHDTFVIRGRLGNNLGTAQTNIPIDVLVRRLHTDPSRVGRLLRGWPRFAICVG